jgi:flagellar hook-associated protein 3 FlgL
VRVTEGQRLASALRDVQGAGRGVARLEEMVSTGKKLIRPSDDPGGAARSVRLGAELRGVDAAERGAQLARGELDATDDALQSLSTTLARARELGVQAASGTLTATDRAAVAAELDGLLRSALELGNRDLDGRRLFGGTATDRPPYELVVSGGATTVAYRGDGVAREQPVGEATLVLGRPGPGPFAGGGGALDALVALRDAVASAGPDPAAAARAALGGVDGALSSCTAALGDAGARAEELTTIEDGLSARRQLVEGLRSAVEDADLSEVIVELRARQSSYDRGMSLLAKIFSTSALDALG